MKYLDRFLQDWHFKKAIEGISCFDARMFEKVTEDFRLLKHDTFQLGLNNLLVFQKP